MMNIVTILLFMQTLNSIIIFDFSEDSNLEGWYVVNDDVMGGKSSATFHLNPDGNGLFKGNVSLENNGGFSSVHYRFQRKEIGSANILVFRVRGDGKKYQARIYANASDNFSYIAYFETSGEWQNIEIRLNNMYPSFRGRKLDKPNFSGNSIEEIAFLIGNNKAESFQLEIDNIKLNY